MEIDLDPNYVWEMWDGSGWLVVPDGWEPDDFTVQYRIKAKRSTGAGPAASGAVASSASPVNAEGTFTLGAAR